ncbi:RES family NAD+ phosphorylase [Vibrio sp. PP-XX7]
MFENTHFRISGTFVRICAVGQAESVLERHSPDRPEARYNRRGQDALYLTATEESARVAMKKYVKHIKSPLVLATYEIEACQLVDLRHPDLRLYKDCVGGDWQDALSKGIEPPSWNVSDLMRENHEIGLIDPSRKDPTVWHVTLFRWNEAGAPSVRVVGDPVPIVLT